VFLYAHNIFKFLSSLSALGHCFSWKPGKGAITSKIKRAIKLKTSPARLAQLLQP